MSIHPQAIIGGLIVVGFTLVVVAAALYFKNKEQKESGEAK